MNLCFMLLRWFHLEETQYRPNKLIDSPIGHPVETRNANEIGRRNLTTYSWLRQRLHLHNTYRHGPPNSCLKRNIEQEPRGERGI